MNTVIALIGAVLAGTFAGAPGSALSPALLWSTAGIWIALALALAALVALSPPRAPRRTAPALTASTCGPLPRACTACAC